MTLKNLIKLDFYAMKPLAKLMICFLIIPIILGIIVNLGVSIMVTLTFVVFMLNMIFSISEKSHFHKLYGVLPIKKSTSVLSRYLFSLIIVALTAIVSFILYIIPKPTPRYPCSFHSWKRLPFLLLPGLRLLHNTAGSDGRS